MGFTPTQNYIYNNTLIQIISGSASLILPHTSATLLFGDIFTCDALQSITPTIAQTGSDNIKFVMIVNGVPTYWNGSAWVASNSTYSQANLFTDVNTNASTLITAPSTLQILMIFQGSGTTTPSISAFLIEMDFIPAISTVAGACAVYCYLQDILGADLAETAVNAQLVAINDTSFVNNNYTVARFTKTADFINDSTGCWAFLNIVQTVDSGNKIRFMVTYEPNTLSSQVETIRFRGAVIPEQTSINITDLTAMDTNQLL